MTLFITRPDIEVKVHGETIMMVKNGEVDVYGRFSNMPQVMNMLKQAVDMAWGETRRRVQQERKDLDFSGKIK